MEQATLPPRIRHALLSFIAGSLLLLSACGGGGGGDAAADTPVGETGTYRLRDAFASFVANGSAASFIASITTGGVTCNGGASLFVAPQQAATFRGTAVQDSVQTLTVSLTSCGGVVAPGGPVAITTVSRFHLNTTRTAVLGVTDDSREDAVARAGGLVLPERIQAGDSGTLGVFDNYNLGAGAPYGTTTVTYSVVSSGSDLRVTLTYTSADNGQPTNYREVHAYLLSAGNVLRAFTIQADDLSDGSSMYLAPNGP
jgi:hypothetical protein